MGRVYLAEKGEGRYALKVLHPSLLEVPGFHRRFLREAEIGKAVHHPNVVRTLDCNQVSLRGTRCAFLVMEYVEGRTLRALLKEAPSMSEDRCRAIGRELAQGLAAIHEAGAVHRDLKPENVLVTPEHTVKITDLGVAWIADEALRLSHSGAFIGSLRYASPEQFGGRGVPDGRSDLYSLGVILYELACGDHPIPGRSFGEVMQRILSEDPRRLRERNPGVSEFFDAVVHMLLRKERSQRFASAAAAQRVLADGEEGPWWREQT
jgi:serine/threonine-protein kinase